jgi:hypothetical protein
MNTIQELVETGSNENFLKVYTCEVKGRGLTTLKSFRKGEFVVEYKGNEKTKELCNLYL